MDFMQIIEINPRDCTRWKYADRSHFEFGNTGSLSEDIKENGQVEPVIVRPLLNSEYQLLPAQAGSLANACKAD
jgi:ParB family chromosome partitioning protein